MNRKRMSREEARQYTRDEILASARRLFGEHGYRATSLEQIAEEAGYSKGAVYSNWSGKEALFLEVLDREAETAENPSLQPSAWALATLEFFVESVGSPEIREALAERYGRAREEVAMRLSGGRDDPGWATWNEIASVVMAVGSGLLIQAAIDPDVLEPDLLERVIWRLTN